MYKRFKLKFILFLYLSNLLGVNMKYLKLRFFIITELYSLEYLKSGVEKIKVLEN